MTEPMKLTYFPVMAKGLGPALVAELSGLPWAGNKDNGFTRDKWAAMKEAGMSPFGQLPLLEDEGLNIGQSIAIVNYIGKKAKTEGDTPTEYAISQMLLAEAEDIYAGLGKFVPSVGGYGYLGFEGTIGENPMTKKGTEAAYAKFWAEWVPEHVSKLETLLAGKDKFTSSGRTVGEVYLFAMLYQLILCKPQSSPELFASTPQTGLFYKTLFDDPSVQKVITGESSMGELKQYFVLPQ